MFALLPPEAAERVLSFVSDTADRKALRLVCKEGRAYVDRGVTAVSLPPVPVDVDELHVFALAAAPWQLRRLDLSREFATTNREAEAISKAHWPGLELLALEGDLYEEIRLGLDEEGTASLAAAAWPRLRSLYIERADLGDGGAMALASGIWPCLHTLSLASSGVGDAGAAALAAANFLRLSSLNLARNEIARAGAAALAAGCWPDLQSLDLTGNRIRSGGAVALAAAGRWPLLQTLRLLENRIYITAARELADVAARKWPRLHSVYFITLVDEALGNILHIVGDDEDTSSSDSSSEGSESSSEGSEGDPEEWPSSGSDSPLPSASDRSLTPLGGNPSSSSDDPSSSSSSGMSSAPGTPAESSDPSSSSGPSSGPGLPARGPGRAFLVSPRAAAHPGPPLDLSGLPHVMQFRMIVQAALGSQGHPNPLDQMQQLIAVQYTQVVAAAAAAAQAQQQQAAAQQAQAAQRQGSAAPSDGEEASEEE